MQVNFSQSRKNVVRGLHFQSGIFSQSKLVTCISGEIQDVLLNLNPNNSEPEISYFNLNAERGEILYIPKGFGHGFSVLEDAVFVYKCSNYYHKESEGGVLWSDPQLQIDWQVEVPIVSEKDTVWPTLAEFAVQEQGGL
jgi:dTDP-4-dehydrorhamnose 3,5-epimerase